MLDDPVKRESVKALGAGGALIAGGPVAMGLSIALGVAVEALGQLGEKRTRELFDTNEFAERVASKIQQSTDFAGFVYSVWQKYNLESNENRRRMLKRFLEKEAGKDVNQFENFSRLESIIQNINLKALHLLEIIHSDVVQKRQIDPNDAASRLLNLSKLVSLVQSVENLHKQDIEYYVNELGSHGLISISYGGLGGPFYTQTKFGYILLDYIRSE
jgi:hypothetical protein